MVFILLEEIIMHMTREILVHVESHTLVFHILEKVVIVVAIVFITVD